MEQANPESVANEWFKKAEKGIKFAKVMLVTNH
jgi:hypothetical protein